MDKLTIWMSLSALQVFIHPRQKRFNVSRFTGFDTTFKLPFPVIGRNGVNINDKWSPHPTTYLSICTDGFPNWFFCIGPNSAIGTGSMIVVIEHQVDYAIAATLKLQRERLKSLEAKQDAVADFDEYLEVCCYCALNNILCLNAFSSITFAP